jgi:SAM-dependent methyltransferase
MPWIKKGIRRFIPTVNIQPDPPLKRTLKLLENEKGIILDIGAGGRVITPNILGVDFLLFPNTKLIADIHHLPFSKDSVSAVICTGVLEHVENPPLAIEEMHRTIKTGHIIHIEVPFMQPYHADPIDYWRWTLPGIRQFCTASGFEQISSGAHLRTQAAMNVILINYMKSWIKPRAIQMGFEFVLRFLLWPFKFLDYFSSEKTLYMPSGVFFVGRKK